MQFFLGRLCCPQVRSFLSALCLLMTRTCPLSSNVNLFLAVYICQSFCQQKLGIGSVSHPPFQVCCSPYAGWLFALMAFPADPRASPAKNGYRLGTPRVGNVGFKSCSFFCCIRGVQPSSKSHPHPGAGLALGKTLHVQLVFTQPNDPFAI